MTDTPAPAAPISPNPRPATTPKTGHPITDPGDASPWGHPEGSDFVPKPQVTPALTVVLPGTSPA